MMFSFLAFAKGYKWVESTSCDGEIYRANPAPPKSYCDHKNHKRRGHISAWLPSHKVRDMLHMLKIVF
jgi:hypothetical protein